ncbi:hypothetical protein M2273_000189 [Mucilaginibacter lappiensis]
MSSLFRGILVTEMADQIAELQPDQLFTIIRDTTRRTRPKCERSVNLTISSGYTKTEDILNTN